MKPSFFFIVSVLFCSVLAMLGCKKSSSRPNSNPASNRTNTNNNNPNNNNGPVYDFTYTGNLLLWDSIKFQSNAPANSTLVWKFGDGIHSFVSTAISPSYAFSIYGSNTVSLIVNNDSAHPITKILQIGTGAQKINGTWNWKGYGSANDTTFPISVLNDTTISVWGEQLKYFNLFFTNTITFRSSANGQMEIDYSQVSDSIFFHITYGSAGSGYTYIDYHTP